MDECLQILSDSPTDDIPLLKYAILMAKMYRRHSSLHLIAERQKHYASDLR
jgi:hypothetical protein